MTVITLTFSFFQASSGKTCTSLLWPETRRRSGGSAGSSSSTPLSTSCSGLTSAWSSQVRDAARLTPFRIPALISHLNPAPFLFAVSGKYGIAAPWYFPVMPSFWADMFGCREGAQRNAGRGLLFSNMMQESQRNGKDKCKGTRTRLDF